jgi:sporulation protein YlmC with PRC-barrel domain
MIQFDMIIYVSNMSRLVLNHKMTKYSNIWANGRKKVSDDKAIPWIAESKSSDQKIIIYVEKVHTVRTFMLINKSKSKFYVIKLFLLSIDNKTKSFFLLLSL